MEKATLKPSREWGYRLAVPVSAGEPPSAEKPVAASTVPAHTGSPSQTSRRRWILASAVAIPILTTGVVLGDRFAQQLWETAEAERLARSAMKLTR